MQIQVSTEPEVTAKIFLHILSRYYSFFSILRFPTAQLESRYSSATTITFALTKKLLSLCLQKKNTSCKCGNLIKMSLSKYTTT